MAILNFPATGPGTPDDGSFTSTQNGVLYVWDGNKWTANSESDLDSRYVERAGDNMTGNLTLGGDKITLDASDGSATFASSVQSGPYIANQNGAIFGCYLDPGGTYYSNVSGADDYNWIARRNGTIYSSIKSDGSASFAGNVTQEGGYIRTSTGSTGVSLYATGLMSATTSESSNALVVKNDSSEEKASIKGDGSAKFGNVRFFDNRVVMTSGMGLWFTADSLVPTLGDSVGNATNGAKDLGSPSTRWRNVYGTTARIGNVVLELDQDDDTKYTSTTNEEGEQTLVYNGAVLDVKDRLTKLDTALSGLKAALVSTTDHASLKAALITALADI